MICDNDDQENDILSTSDLIICASEVMAITVPCPLQASVHFELQ